jgi:hypothetical protein
MPLDHKSQAALKSDEARSHLLIMPPTDPLQHVVASLKGMLDAIDLLIEGRRCRPALVLLYSTIDACASLGRPRTRKYVTGADFVSWADQYVLASNAELQCTALDLYAARCGLLHTHAPEAKLIDEGKARTILYAWGGSSIADLRLMLGRIGKSETHAGIHVNDLRIAVKLGIVLFLEEVRVTPTLHALVSSRAKMLAPLSGDEMKTFLATSQYRTRRRGQG